MRYGLRILILAACVPLVIPPGVCLCEGPKVVARLPGVSGTDGSRPLSGPHHSHGHPGGCCCIGELGLNEDDALQPAPVFALVLAVPVESFPVTADVPPPCPPVASTPPAGFPRHLTHLALLI